MHEALHSIADARIHFARKQQFENGAQADVFDLELLRLVCVCLRVEYEVIIVSSKCTTETFKNKFIIPIIFASLSLLNSISSDMNSSSKCCRVEKPNTLILCVCVCFWMYGSVIMHLLCVITESMKRCICLCNTYPTLLQTFSS